MIDAIQRRDIINKLTLKLKIKKEGSPFNVITESQMPKTDRNEKRSDDDSVYREFAPKMAAQIVLNNRSDSVDKLIETLKESKYYKTI